MSKALLMPRRIELIPPTKGTCEKCACKHAPEKGCNVHSFWYLYEEFLEERKQKRERSRF